MDYPQQLGGDPGCLCRTCSAAPAVYLDQCEACRALSTVADDKEYLRPGGPCLLENWAVVYAPGVSNYTPPEMMVQLLKGNVYRHPRHPPGTSVCTSPPVGRTADNLVITATGRRYKLGRVLPDYDKAVGGNARERALASLPVKP